MSKEARDVISICNRILEVRSDLTSLSNERLKDVKVKLKEAVELLTGFEKKAWLKTRSGKEQIQLILESAQKLEEMLMKDYLDELLFLNTLIEFEESVKKVDEDIKRRMWIVT